MGWALCGKGMELVLLAYADDMLPMVTDPVDQRRMHECKQVFSAAFSARINWEICSMLLVGPWQIDSLLVEISSFVWRSRHLLYLEVHLSSTNDRRPGNKSHHPLGCRSSLLRVLPNRGRVLVTHQLVASMLLYRLVILVLPFAFVASIQRKLAHFFWENRKHWVSTVVLHHPIQEGRSITGLQKYLYSESTPCWHALVNLVTFGQHAAPQKR